MKKLITLLVLFSGIIPSASAWDDGDLFLRSNATDGSWSDNFLGYKFTKTWIDEIQKDRYEITIPVSKMPTNENFSFRLYRYNYGFQTAPSSTNHTYSFEDGKNGYYNATSGSDYQSEDRAFIIPHLTIGASEYKITVYIKYDSPWTYEINAEIVSMPLTITSLGVSTFSSNRALDFSTLSASFTAKTITEAAAGILTTSSGLSKVPANTGLYIEGTAATYDVPVVPFSEPDATADAFTNNLLKCGTGTSVSQTDGGNTNYILTRNIANGNVDTPKFYKVNTAGNTVPAGKAYLQIPTANAAPEFFWFGSSTPTDIDMVHSEGVKDNGSVFNLAGQRVAHPTKGLYIVNGRKVVIK